MIEVKIQQAISMLSKYLLCGLVPMIVSSPAIGKSQAVYAVAKMYNLKVIDLRLSQSDPTDLNGFPNIKGNKASYIPMDTFPIEGDAIPEGYSGWLLFFDELTSSPKAVQAASYKIILDRMVGLHKLHKNVAMVAAGNLSTDRAIVEEMSTALMSRLVHIKMVVDAPQWVSWASEKNFDHRITSGINFKPGNLYTFNPETSDETYASPRTWEFANRIMQQTSLDDPDLLPLLAGTLSEGVAREFLAFCKIHESLPKIADISANPMGVKVPDAPSVLYALTGAIAHHMTVDNVDQLVKFIYRMLPEFQMVCVRESVRRNKALMSTKAIQDWIASSAATLF